MSFKILQFNMQYGQPWDDTYPDTAPIKLQSHNDPSPPISFRNIWVRELK